QVTSNNVTYKFLNSLLFIHDQNQDVNLDFWRILVPDDEKVKTRIIQELHSTPYSAHPGVQRTIGRVRQSFYWKGMTETFGNLWIIARCVRWKNLTTNQPKAG
ncbi:MAG: hypothetical protein OIF54_09960, partial [Cohaesibacter sp.]|nr:hypothetical protein [Cohaesibacter sp.]